MEQNNIELKDNKENKPRLGEDGFLHVKMSKKVNTEVVKFAVDEYKKIVNNNSAKPGISIDVAQVNLVSSSSFRRDTAAILKEVYNNPGFKKIAIWGGNLFLNTVILFIIKTTRLENIKFFSTEGEALKWLKEE